MRIYLASGFSLVGKVREVAERLEKAGHTITCKWWLWDDKKKADAVSDAEWYQLPEIQFLHHRDRKGIQDADILILVADGTPRKFNGANIEVGMALAWGKPVLSVGELDRSAMYAPVIKCGSIDRLIDVIRLSENVESQIAIEKDKTKE